ncbi:serine/arginine-rich SC35-like splicing factor SCL30 [Phytophthora cinnamomi]|uniref:serine/arginine-rich SC35-like splicing factor SCL30 n=1 Tax=Phytophthora cinnamomi TaxID=4785 RepID=UPI00355A5D67|nr:serine/arginine-rich SC35-like splicing factor SCL30 [Phytophthora cinnamomi]
MGDRGGISLLVRNISRRLRPEDIRKEFERYGEVRDVYIPKDYYTKEPKGFAFVEFRSEREADDARRNLDGVRIDGRDIRVVFAQERRKSTEQMREREKTERRGGGRRSRSRSPRRRAPRGRSRSRPIAFSFALELPRPLASASVGISGAFPVPAQIGLPARCGVASSFCVSSPIGFAGCPVAVSFAAPFQGPIVLAITSTR